MNKRDCFAAKDVYYYYKIITKIILKYYKMV